VSTCIVCGKATAVFAHGNVRKTCSSVCLRQTRKAAQPPPTRPHCTQCGAPAARSAGGGQKNYWRKTCGKKCRAASSSVVVSHTNHVHASARMKRNNPMQWAHVRVKQKESLAAIGWKPPVRGGNGHDLPAPQQALADALGWPCQVIVKTGNGYLPAHYKLNIANEALGVAIEVDGQSHRALNVQRTDERKERFLSAHGWTVLRFKNEDVEADLPACVQAVMCAVTARCSP
jgi:hypothetical protein